jgi:cytochrome bd-type quinol oxidase subunit 2
MSPAAPAPLASFPGGFGSYAVPPGSGAPGASFEPTSSTREADHRALEGIAGAAVVILLTGVVSVLVLAVPESSLPLASTSGGDVQFAPAFYALVLASAALSIVIVVLLRGSFRRLGAFDSRFSTPAKYSLLLLVGIVVLAVGLLPLTFGESIGNCMASNNGTLSGNCRGLGEIAVGGLLVLAGGIMSLVGYVAILLGIWRSGARYREDMFKVGAVLLLIPLLSIVGGILILVAARSARTKLGGAPVG